MIEILMYGDIHIQINLMFILGGVIELELDQIMYDGG
jgi:hypothetical protein